MNVFDLSSANLLSISNMSIESDVADVIGINADACNHIDISEMEFLGVKYTAHMQDGGWYHMLNCLSRASATQEAGGFVMRSSQGGNGSGEGNYGAVNSTVIGCGFILNGTGRSEFILLKRAANVIISACIFDGRNSGVDCFTIHDDAQGIQISDSSINFWGNAITSEIGTYSGEVNRAPRLVTLSNVEFDQNATHSVNAIDLVSSAFSECPITSSGVATDTNPYYFGTGADDIKVAGGMIAGYDGVGGVGVDLDGCTLVTVKDVTFRDVYTCVNFDTTTTIPTSCNVRGLKLKSTIVNKIGGDPSGGGNRISSNFDNNFANTGTTIPASGVDLLNDTGYDVTMNLSGGTITALTINTAPFVFSSAITVDINAGDTINITYTGSPTFRWLTRR